jgi:hypothetical protein
MFCSSNIIFTIKEVIYIKTLFKAFAIKVLPLGMLILLGIISSTTGDGASGVPTQ